MRILALDLATATGWATNQFGRIESGVQRFDLLRGESVGMRWLRFNAWLRHWDSARFAPDERIQLIVYEQNFLRGQAPTEIAMGFSTRVHEFVEQQRQAGYAMEHTAVNNTVLKIFTTGNRNVRRVSKELMTEHARQRGWLEGMVGSDDNEVDARCLLQWALSTYGQ